MSDIVVFGSFVVDLMARASHLPVPGETVKSSMFQMGAGGKGSNQGVAASLAGADMVMVTKVGEDSFAEFALSQYKKANMCTDYVFVSKTEPTGTALIMVDENSSQNAIMVTSGACGTFDDADITKINSLIRQSKILLVQLEVNLNAIEKVIDIAYQNGVRIVLNPAPIQPITDDLLKKVDIITPNETEASILTGVDVRTEVDASCAAKILLDKGVKEVVITLGKLGVLAVTAEKHQMFKNYDDIKVVDTTGAGDAFNGGFVTALVQGKDLFDACAFGNVVSNLSVSKLGTAQAMPTRSEIDAFIASHPLP